jgi:hypothetical protein
MNPSAGASMNAPLLLLITCYALLAIAVLALCLYTKWSFWIKTVAIAACFFVFLLAYDTMTALLGFPSPGRMPERFLLHYALVIQPDKNTGNKGTVYIWATELTKQGPTKVPRAYELPYDKELSNLMTEANRRTKQGIMQMGQTQEPAQMKGAINTFTKYMSGSKPLKIRMQDLPEPALPDK